MSDKDKKELQIRNSTIDFLVFTKDAKEDGIEVRVQNGDVWLTQKAIGQLFDVDRSVVTKHLKNIYGSGELDEDRTCANFAQVADNGKTYRYKFYSLSAIIAVGYRINSGRATQFRQWATKVLDTFTKQGYVLDKNRLINGQIFDEDYFDHLISEIQEIRASERRFYQKITDIYATAVDYAVDSQITKDFFATVQNKMHYAVHGNTAAEVIVARADHTKEHMGLTTWKNAPGGKIVKADVSVAKNYLSKGEMQELNEIVTMYLDYATRQARRHIPMTMADWASKLDAFLQFNDADILHDKGKVTAAIAKAFAESEFEQYRVIQDRLYQSDFDRLVASTETEEDNPALQEQIDQRKLLQKQRKNMAYLAVRESRKPGNGLDGAADYNMQVLYGDRLLDLARPVTGWGKRDCYDLVDRYMKAGTFDRVCLVYGLRRTGKTTIIKQIINDMTQSELARTVYMKATSGDSMAGLNADLKRLQMEGYCNFFIDEVTLMGDFVESAGLLSDVYAAQGVKIVLSGTDSLGFYFAMHEELYDRAVMVHTTYIPFREHSRLLKISSIDEYIRYGGTLRAGELEFENADINAKDASFRDDESTRRYIDTAISRNIQHALACYQEGRYFRHLKELYEAGELTNAINRIIQNLNHDFTVKVVTEQFRSRDLRSAAQLLRKERDEAKRTDILDRIDTEDVVNGLMRILDIWNREDQTVAVSPAHLTEIREYLKALDLIETVEVETAYPGGEPIEHIIFTQPGMRYCQAQALLYLLMKDVQFRTLGERDKTLVTEKILEDIRGIMMEDIVLLETKHALSDQCPGRYLVCKLRFAAGEYEMVIYDRKTDTCQLYEIKHSSKMDDGQLRHLQDPDKQQAVTHRFGTIVGKYVLYTGEDADPDHGVRYRNVEAYLNRIWESFDET